MNNAIVSMVSLNASSLSLSASSLSHSISNGNLKSISISVFLLSLILFMFLCIIFYFGVYVITIKTCTSTLVLGITGMIMFMMACLSLYIPDPEFTDGMLALEKSILRYQSLHASHELPDNIEVLLSPAALTSDESIDGKTYGPFIEQETIEAMYLKKRGQNDDLTCHPDCELYNKHMRRLRCNIWDITIKLQP